MQKKRKFGSAPQKSAFKPRTKDDNFLLSVIMTTGKMLFLTILILGIAGGGLLVVAAAEMAKKGMSASEIAKACAERFTPIF